MGRYQKSVMKMDMYLLADSTFGIDGLCMVVPVRWDWSTHRFSKVQRHVGSLVAGFKVPNQRESPRRWVASSAFANEPLSDRGIVVATVAALF